MEKLLQNIAVEIVAIFRNDSNFVKDISLRDYHGFMKGLIPNSTLEEISKKLDVDPKSIQAELVRVHQDLSKEIHLHKQSHALCIILGGGEHLSNPKHAFALKNGKWMGVSKGDVFNIPPGTSHGFTVEDGGILYFLSIQSPPIENADGSDDYVKLDL